MAGEDGGVVEALSGCKWMWVAVGGMGDIHTPYVQGEATDVFVTHMNSLNNLFKPIVCSLTSGV